MKNYSENPRFQQLSEVQLRQLGDAQAVFLNLAAARVDVTEVKGSMRWKTVVGRQYLVRVSTTGSEKSLGPRDPNLERIFTSFHDRKNQAQARYTAMRERYEEMRRLNRAYRVGRTPTLVVKRLNAIEAAGLADQFLTVSQALYAYETAAGVRVDTRVLPPLSRDFGQSEDGFQAEQITQGGGTIQANGSFCNG